MHLKTMYGLTKIRRSNLQQRYQSASTRQLPLKAVLPKRRRPKYRLVRIKTVRGLVPIQRYNYLLQRRRTVPKKLISIFRDRIQRRRKVAFKHKLLLYAKRLASPASGRRFILQRQTKRITRRLNRHFNHYLLRLQQLQRQQAIAQAKLLKQQRQQAIAQAKLLKQHRPAQHRTQPAHLPPLSIKQLLGRSTATQPTPSPAVITSLPAPSNQPRQPAPQLPAEINKLVTPTKTPPQFTPARRPASQRRPMFYDPLKPTNKRYLATQRPTYKAVSAKPTYQRPGQGQPTNRRGRVTPKNQHLRDIGAEYYNSKQTGIKSALVQRQMDSRIALYGRMLTQNSPYYQKGLFTPGTAAKFDTLARLPSDFDKRRYIYQRTHRIDVTTTDEVRFNLAPIKYKAIYKDNSDKLFEKPDDYYVVRIPIFFDPYLGNGKLQQPGLTYVRGNLLMIVEPINRVIYYVNTAVASAVNLEIRYIQPHSGRRKLRVKHQFPKKRRYYVLKKEQNFTRTHFIQLCHPKNAVSNTAKSGIQRQDSERFFKGGIPVLSPSAFRSPTKRRLSSQRIKQRRRSTRRYQLAHQLVSRRLDLLQRAGLTQALSAGHDDAIIINLAALRARRLAANLLTKTHLSALTQRPMFKTLTKLGAAHNNEIRYHYNYEYRAFKGKFFSRRGYFAYSRGKRSIIFRGLVRKAGANYRKLQKNPLFIKLLRVHLYHTLGMQEVDMGQLGRQVRRGQTHIHTSSVVKRFNQSLQLKLDGLAMFLGLAPNRPAAQQLVICGSLRINGLVVTNYNTILTVNDMLQVDLSMRDDIRALYTETHGDVVEARVKITSFLQAIWPMMMFMMVRGPYQHELMEESILTGRGIRYYIRYFPVKMAKYRQPKVEGLKY